MYKRQLEDDDGRTVLQVAAAHGNLDQIPAALRAHHAAEIRDAIKTDLRRQDKGRSR
mgnify:CR=1 FL=1